MTDSVIKFWIYLAATLIASMVLAGIADMLYERSRRDERDRARAEARAEREREREQSTAADFYSWQD